MIIVLRVDDQDGEHMVEVASQNGTGIYLPILVRTESGDGFKSIDTHLVMDLDDKTWEGMHA